MKRENDFIYFLRPVGQKGPIKIGCSKLPSERLKQLMIWSPYPLEIVTMVPGDLALERRLHTLFKASHSHFEWFSATPALTKLIDDVAAGVPITSLIDMSAPLTPLRKIKEAA